MRTIDVKWIKLSTDMLLNSKIVKLRTEKNGDKLLLIWIILLMVAGKCNMGGRLMLTENIPSDKKTLSKEMGFSEKLLEQAFEQFVRLNMIEFEDGVYSIKNWEKYQNVDGMDKIREQTRKRVAKHRAKCNDTVTQDVTLRNATEEEEEREKETEKDKDTLSIIHICTDEAEQNVEKPVVDAGVEIKLKLMRRKLVDDVVKLNRVELIDLADKLCLYDFGRYVDIVRNNELAGKHYTRKSHYQAILDMAGQDGRLP